MAPTGLMTEVALPQYLEASEPPEARGLRRDEVRLLVSDITEDSIEHASDDAQARALAEARVDAERIVAATESALEDDADLLDAGERTRIERALAEVRRLHAEEDRHALARSVEALNTATGDFAARRMDRGVARALAGKRVDALR